MRDHRANLCNIRVSDHQRVSHDVHAKTQVGLIQDDKHERAR